MDSRNNDIHDNDQESVRDMFLDREGNDAVTWSLQVQERVHEQIRLDNRFTEMKCQISAFSSLVRDTSDRVSHCNIKSEISTPNPKEQNGIIVVTSQSAS